MQRLALATVALALALALAATAAAAAAAADPCGNNNFMPLPNTLTCDNSAVLQFEPQFFSFAFAPDTSADAGAVALVQRALNRYKEFLLFGDHPHTPPAVQYRSSIFENRINASVQTVAPTRFVTAQTQYTLTIQLPSSALSAPLTPAALGATGGVDESYTLSLGTDAATGGVLSGNTVWGVLRGLETLTQAIQWTAYQGVSGYYVLNAPLHIVDAPRFPWRGLLLDTARNYHPLSSVFHVIDSMAYMKLNVLHWHLSDAESFPLLSALHPELARYSAYSANATYSAANFSAVIAHALDRGIRVIPEVDSPGHMAALGQAYPHVIADCYAYVAGSQALAWPAWDSVALDVTNPETRPLVASVLGEVAGAFADPYFHIGGDEVKTSCWAHFAPMTQWMQTHGLATLNATTQKWTYAWRNLTDSWELWLQHDVMRPLNRTAIVWEEAFLNSAGGPGRALDPNTVVHIWQSGDALDQAVNAGFRVVNSFGWYVDRQNPTCSTDDFNGPSQFCPTMWMWEWTWHTMYAVDPVGFLTQPTAQHVAQVLGGEIAVFGESVDRANFDARVWTRAPPIAERLWSAATVTSLVSAQTRFSALRCLWARRGIRMGPSVPAYCQLAEDDGFPPFPPGPAPNNSSDDSHMRGLATAFIVLFVVSGVLNCFLFTLYRKAKQSTSVNTEYQRDV